MIQQLIIKNNYFFFFYLGVPFFGFFLDFCAQHAPRTRQHCRPCGIHAHDTQVRAHTCLHGLFSVEHSYQPGTFQCTSSCNNRLRCRWIPQRTIKLRVAWQVMDNTRPVRGNTADRALCTLVTQRYVRVLVCTVCFQ